MVEGLEPELTTILSSRSAIRWHLRNSKPELTAASLFTECLEAAAGWKADSDTPRLVGLLNLFVELSEKPDSKTRSFFRDYAYQPVNRPTPFIEPFRQLAWVYGVISTNNHNDHLLTCGCSREPWTFESRHSLKRLASVSEEWDLCLKRVEVTQAEPIHLVVMHLLQKMLPTYSNEQVPARKALLDVLLLPMIRTVFRCPDRAHVVYGRYFYGEAAIARDDPFHRLYAAEIRTVETFKSLTVAKRSDVLQEVVAAARQAVPQGDDGEGQASLPEPLQKSANWIVHGVHPDESAPLREVESPDPKMTSLSQMTLLIAKPGADGAIVGRRRHYGSYLGGIQYRRPTSAEATNWDLMSEADRVQPFQTKVADFYKDGYEVEELATLFRGDSEHRRFPVWLPDGEVTFLGLLKQIKESESVDRVIDSLHLFEGNADKAWALVNFLVRIHYGKPQGCASGPIERIASSLYESIANKALTRASLVAGLDALIKTAELANVVPEKHGRLKSYSLEFILRGSDPVCYSLFFLPLSLASDMPESPSEERHDAVDVPAIFIAGTFVALEGRQYPFVTLRNDYHLFSLLDALRPIVDHQIGMVLRGNQQMRLRAARQQQEAEERKKAAEAREKTMLAVLPAAKRLSDLFREAQGNVFQIESAVDPDWGGLFGGAMHQAVGRLFETDTPLVVSDLAEFKESGITEIKGRHALDNAHNAKTFLYQALVYLARVTMKYSEETTLGDAYKPHENVTTVLGNVFKQNALLRAFFDAVFRPSDAVDALTAFRLLKLLAYDSMDSAKGLHLVQVASGLAIASARNEDETPAVKVNTLDFVKQLSDENQKVVFSPHDPNGIANLCRLLAVVDATPHPVDCQHSVPLRLGAPGAFLRALCRLATEGLKSSRPSDVRFRNWSLTYTVDPTPSLIVTLYCNGRFDPSVKSKLAEYNESGGDYHSLRTTFRDFCASVGGPPRYVTATGVPDHEYPFVIAETSDRNSWTSEFRILLAPQPVAMPAGAAPSLGHGAVEDT